ncbi:MAG: hypothetical protein AVDCRST_MAG66-460, partial [uncultured Pseudonocardia sp.]
DGLGAAAVARRAPPGRRRRAGFLLFATSAVGVLAVFAGTVLVPPPLVPEPRPALPGERQVDVATGSRLTVVSRSARGAVTGPPIVVVPGGPGIPDLDANLEALEPLTALGRDLHLYAPTGTDRSTRLPDPRGYGRDRDVADLEALLRELGLDRVVLVGHSHGAHVAAAHLTAHQERVDRLVLVSPGPLDPADTSGSRATAGLDFAHRVQLYGQVLAPRPLLAYALLQVDPLAAKSLLGDVEADARNDAVLTAAEPALRCPGSPGAGPVRGSGFYAHQYPQSRTAAPPPDIRPALSGRTTPALVVKGRCDYLSWGSAVDYADALPSSRLLYLPDAGHNAHQERAGAVRGAVGAFLAGAVVGDPVPDAPPPGYAGPSR